MKNTFYLILLFAISQCCFAQDHDPVAKGILDKLSNKTKQYSSIKTTFIYTMENNKENISESQKGVLLLKGEKHKLDISGQQIINNGTTLWTFIEDADEVQVSEPEYEEGTISPSNIFTIYESGFKYKFHKEETINGIVQQQINLYPENANEKAYHTIRLSIDKAKMQITSIRIFGKEGDDYIYTIEDFKTNLPVSDTDFQFDPAKYPDVEVIDLR